MSKMLTVNLKKIYTDGSTLVESSKKNEYLLNRVIDDLLELFNIILDMEYKLPGKIILIKKMTLYECQKKYYKDCGYKNAPIPDESNNNVYFSPDGGILMYVYGDIKEPILITEDKLQGTNDKLHILKKKKQSTGNAIERAGKNINLSKMLFANSKIFPYVLFASGCDFHDTETIAKRLEAMNFSEKNHYLKVDKTQKEDEYDINYEKILENININKRYGIYNSESIASIFVKAHKYDELPPNSSLWTYEEIYNICFKIIDLSLKELKSIY